MERSIFNKIRRRSSSRPSLRRRSSSKHSVKDVTPATEDEVVPSVKAVLDNTLPSAYFKQDILSLLKGLKIRKWAKLDKNAVKELNVERISGALTNSVYKVSYKKLPPLLLRVYGSNVDSIIDRESELKVLVKLSKKNIGARLIGCFTNGRFEQYLANPQTLDKEMIREPKISRLIGRRMKELHTGVPLEEEDFQKGPTVWLFIEKWLLLAEEMLKQFTSDQQKKILIVDLPTLRKILDVYKKWLYSKYNDKFDLVFCHNDTQYGNLLFYTPLKEDELNDLTEQTQDFSFASSSSIHSTGSQTSVVLDQKTSQVDSKLVVIDFEYSGANVPAYDIINHFCEWMADYSDPSKSYFLDEKRYPNTEERLNYITSYVHTQGFGRSGRVGHDLETEVKRLYNESILWRCANSVSWALWGLAQGKHQLITREDSIKTEVGPNGERYKVIPEELEIAVEGIEEMNLNVDDDFDYLKYTLQKMSMALGDLLQFGLVDERDVERNGLKLLDCEFLI